MEGADDLKALADWIRLDQRDCWRTGKGKFVEEYFADHPRLTSDRNLSLDVIYEEFCLRRALDESVEPKEYVERFPDLASELHRLFEIHDALDEVVVADRSLRQPPTIHFSSADSTHSLRKFPAGNAISPVQEAKSPAADDDRLPPRVGRYDIKEALGSGAFATVYRAFDSQLVRDVAIKVPRHRCFDSPEQLDLYLSEARTLASLDHPHIVPIYDVGGTREHPCFIVSKLVDGTDLGRRMQSQEFSTAASVRIVAAIADALHHAHLKGLVHRDVKPANILLDANDCPVLADFGLALHDGDLGKYPGIMGTLAYMSPEQARGEAHRVDGRSDIFSLGVVLYELLTHKRPFRSDDPSELRQQITSMDARPLRQVDGKISLELERICLKCLAKRPSDRYATAADLADDLRQYLKPSATTKVDETVRAFVPARPRRFAPRHLAVLGVVIALLVGSLAWSLRKSPAVSTPMAPTAGGDAVTEIRQFNAEVYRQGPDGLAFVGTLRDDVPPLPLQANDEVGIRLELAVPAFVYLVWIDTSGEAIPVYPWTVLGDWKSLPVLRSTSVVEVPRLTMSEDEPPGMETIVVLVRSDPLPHDFDLESQFRDLPKPVRPPQGSLVHVENGAVVAQQSTVYRGPSRFSASAADTVVQLQRTLYRRLSRDFQHIASLSFPCYDEAPLENKDQPNSAPADELTRAALVNASAWSLNLEGQPQALPLIKRGKQSMREADFVRASDLFTQALAHLDPADVTYPQVRSYVLSELGHAHCKLGDYLAARRLFEEALRVLRDGGESLPVLFHATNGLTSLLKDQGEYHAAISQCEAALRLIEAYAPRSVVQRAILLGNLGVLLAEQSASGRRVDALRCAEESLEIMQAYEAQTGDSRYVHTAYNNLGYVLAKAGDHKRALAMYEQSLRRRRELLHAHHPLIARSLEKVAEELACQMQLQDAEANYRAAMQINDHVYGDLPNGHLHWVSNANGLGRVLAARGKPSEARDVLERAEKMERRFALDFVSGASEAESLNYLAYRLGPADELLSLYLHNQVPGHECYAHVAARKAITYRRLAVRNRLRSRISPEEQAAIEEYSRVIKQLAALSVVSHDANAELTRTMATLGARKDSLERRLASLESSFAADDLNVDSVLPQLTSLPSDTLILDFIRFQRHSFAHLDKTSPEYAVYAISSRGVQLITLPNADRIDDLIWAWRDNLLNDRRLNRNASTRLAREELYDRLWAPVARVIPEKTRNVWVCPDGAIVAVPWPALGPNDGRCLIDEYCFATVPHTLSVLTHTAARSDRRRLLLVGDVINDEQPRLTAAGDEIQAVAALARDMNLDVESLTGRAATADHVLRSAAAADWIHLAVHGAFLGESLLGESLADLTRGLQAEGERGTVLARNPLTLSGLYLAGTESSPHGFMSAQFVATQDLGRSRGVVLSACETGVGDSARGEGVFSLQRAFHLAGATSVLASLWKVEDESTRDFMVAFYQLMFHQNISAPDALCATQRMMRDRGEKASRWSGFNVSLSAMSPN